MFHLHNWQIYTTHIIYILSKGSLYVIQLFCDGKCIWNISACSIYTTDRSTQPILSTYYLKVLYVIQHYCNDHVINPVDFLCNCTTYKIYLHFISTLASICIIHKPTSWIMNLNICIMLGSNWVLLLIWLGKCIWNIYMHVPSTQLTDLHNQYYLHTI